jgi:hypothetical protein
MEKRTNAPVDVKDVEDPVVILVEHLCQVRFHGADVLSNEIWCDTRREVRKAGIQQIEVHLEWRRPTIVLHANQTLRGRTSLTEAALAIVRVPRGVVTWHHATCVYAHGG